MTRIKCDGSHQVPRHALSGRIDAASSRALRGGRTLPLRCGRTQCRHDDRDDPAVPVREDTARRAAHHRRLGLHRDGQRAVILAGHGDHAQAVEADEKVTTVAVAAERRAARHIGSGIVEVLEIRRGKSPLILGDLDPSPAQPTASRVAFTPHSSRKSPFAFGEVRVVGGVPGDPEALGDPGHGRVLTHDPFQRPPQRAADNFARHRGPAVSWRHMCPQPVHRYLSTAAEK